MAQIFGLAADGVGSTPTFTTVTTGSVITTSNGAGQNVKIGDDAWLGDINVSNTIGIRGVENAALGGIRFGNGTGQNISTDGTNLNISTSGTINLSGLVKIPQNTPASATAGGSAGMIAWDSTHFYLCVADNTWVRANLSTW